MTLSAEPSTDILYLTLRERIVSRIMIALAFYEHDKGRFKRTRQRLVEFKKSLRFKTFEISAELLLELPDLQLLDIFELVFREWSKQR